jgi:PAS domain S-box-containing protein
MVSIRAVITPSTNGGWWFSPPSRGADCVRCLDDISQTSEPRAVTENSINDLSLTDLMAASDAAILFLDRELRMERFTRPMARLFGLVESDLGRPLGNFAARFGDIDLPQDCIRLLDGQSPAEIEIHSEDQGRDYLRRLSPYRSNEQDIIGIIVSFVDITSRIEAKSRIRNLASVLRDSNDAVIISNLDNRITGWNRGAERAYGYTEAEALELELSALIPEPYQGTIRQVTERALGGQKIDRYETQRIAKNGRIIDVEVTVTPLRDHGGRISGIARTERDISARLAKNEEVRQLNLDLEKRVAERTAELEAANSRLSAILDASGDAIVTVNSAGRIETFNKSAETMFGYSGSDVIGRDAAILVSPRYRDRGSQSMSALPWSEHPIRHNTIRELRACRSNGTEFPAQVSIAPVDHLDLCISIIRDVTEQRTLQEEILRIAASEQRRIGEELHDSTQQELTGLGLLAQNLSEIDPRSQPDEVRRLAARLASGLAESNRHVQRIAKGLMPVAIDADGLMVALSELAARATEETGIECEFNCPARIQIPDDTMALHLYRIVQEAVNNAIKHASANRISIALNRSVEATSVIVEDNGIGISPNDLESDGIGVRLMQHRCELIGGTFSIERRLEGGTAVRCEIPEATNGKRR